MVKPQTCVTATRCSVCDSNNGKTVRYTRLLNSVLSAVLQTNINTNL